MYDPQQKTLLADKGEIRVGPKYQCDIQPLLKDGMSLKLFKKSKQKDICICKHFTDCSVIVLSILNLFAYCWNGCIHGLVGI